MRSFVLGLAVFLILVTGNGYSSSEEMPFSAAKDFMEANLIEFHNSVDIANLTLEEGQLTFAIHPTGNTKEAVRSAVRDTILTYQISIGIFDKEPAHGILIKNMKIIIIDENGKRLGSTMCPCALIWRGQDVEPVTDTCMKIFEPAR
jgi:hypothetical protein